MATRPVSWNNSLMLGTLSGLYFRAALTSTRRRSRLRLRGRIELRTPTVVACGGLGSDDHGKHTRRRRRTVPHLGARSRGGVRSRRSHRRAADVRADRRGVHAEGGAAGRAAPLRARLDADAAAAEEGERPRSAAARDSTRLRRPRPRSDQRVVCRRADRGQPVVWRVARRAHLDRHAAARLLRHRRAEGALPAAARQRRADRRLRAHRAAVRIGRARGAHDGDADAPTAGTTC